jgi:hypothetical protein
MKKVQKNSYCILSSPVLLGNYREELVVQLCDDLEELNYTFHDCIKTSMTMLEPSIPPNKNTKCMTTNSMT